jgi:hypothetical protein
MNEFRCRIIDYPKGLGKYFDESNNLIENCRYSLIVAQETYEAPGDYRPGPFHITGVMSEAPSMGAYHGLSRMILELEDGRRIAFVSTEILDGDEFRIQCFGDFFTVGDEPGRPSE